MLRIDIVTLFPAVVEPYLNASILKRAREKKRVRFGVHDLRQWGEGKRHTVDDAPFGGGPGMVLAIAPIYRSLQSLKIPSTKFQIPSKQHRRTRVILTSAKGRPFTQRDAERYAKKYDRLVILCGRYEGVDERVAKYLADEEVSVGPYVLTGGELPALTITDAVTRLIPGVLGAAESLREESFTMGSNRKSKIENRKSLEYPHYTRPATFSPHRNTHWRVPPILLSGDHQKIATWRKKMRRTVLFDTPLPPCYTPQ